MTIKKSDKIKSLVSKVMKKTLSMVLTLGMMTTIFTGAGLPASAAGAFPASTSKPIHTSTISAANNTTGYTDENLTAKGGTAYASDNCQILEIKNAGGRWIAKASYPVSGGTKTLFFPLSAFTSATSLGEKGTAAAGFDVTSRPGGAKYGSVSANDMVYWLAESNGWVQVLYNLGSASNPTGYKMGWVQKSVYTANVRLAGSNPEGCVDRATALSKNTFNFQLWAFDADTSNSLDIHLYVGGPAGSGAPGYAFTANQARSDVKARFSHCKTQYVGLNKTLTIENLDLTNGTTLYFYAINQGGGTNVLIGTKFISCNGLTSPVPEGSKFSKKTDDSGWYGHHDINRNVSKSTPVYAIADGTVTLRQAYTVVNGKQYLTSYGNFAEFKSADGVYTAKYCHLDSFNGVNQVISSANTLKQSGSGGKHTLATKTVKKGDIIGYIGTTGNSSGVHLHLEIFKNGKRVDPVTLFPNLI